MRTPPGECIDCGCPAPTWSKRCYQCQTISNSALGAVARACTGVSVAGGAIQIGLPATLYAVGVADDSASPVKFGTSNNPAARLKGLQIGCPYHLELIGVIPSRRGTEKLVHRYLHASRIHGEWFCRTQRTREVIELILSGSHDKLLAQIQLRRTVNQQLILQKAKS